MKYYQIRQQEIKYKVFKKVESKKVTGSQQVYDWFRELENAEREKFITCYLNSANEIICFNADFLGGVNYTAPAISIILRDALLCNCTALIVLHNHPSGNCQPSEDDKRFTERLGEGCKLLDMKLLDHLIIGYEGYFSFADEGLRVNKK